MDQIFVVGSENACISIFERSSKVTDIGTNRKHACNFLLVINNNLGRILPPFQRYCRFSALKSTPSLFHSNFGVFPLDYISDVVAPRSEDPINYSDNY